MSEENTPNNPNTDGIPTNSDAAGTEVQTSPSTPSARHRARKMALQATYQWLLSGGSAREIERQFLKDSPTKKADLNFFHALLFAIIHDHASYELIINPLLDRPFSQIDAIEKAILYIGTHELKHDLGTPYRVVINEGIELAKKFGATDSHKYINGVLDKLANQLRSKEKSARR